MIFFMLIIITIISFCLTVSETCESTNKFALFYFSSFTHKQIADMLIRFHDSFTLVSSPFEELLNEFVLLFCFDVSSHGTCLLV